MLSFASFRFKFDPCVVFIFRVCWDSCFCVANAFFGSVIVKIVVLRMWCSSACVRVPVSSVSMLHLYWRVFAFLVKFFSAIVFVIIPWCGDWGSFGRAKGREREGDEGRGCNHHCSMHGSMAVVPD